MNIQEFKLISESLASGVRSGRHLFFFQEAEDEILNLLRTSLRHSKQSAKRLQILNISELAESLPNWEVVLTLKEKLKVRLEEILSVGTPQFLVITNPMLLVRYEIGLAPLYEHYLRDGTAIIVVLPSVPSQELLDALPNCIKIDVETLRRPFPEVGRIESPLIEF